MEDRKRERFERCRTRARRKTPPDVYLQARAQPRERPSKTRDGNDWKRSSMKIEKIDRMVKKWRMGSVEMWREMAMSIGSDVRRRDAVIDAK
jgi:hypothetical protein